MQSNVEGDEKSSGPRLVIVGVGNLLLGDEGFGIHVVNELKKHRLPERVGLCDCGTGGLSVLSAMEGFEKAVIVDAISSGGEPGTVYRHKLDETTKAKDAPRMISPHELNLVSIVRIGWKSYRLPEEIIVIGAEPKTLEPGLDLSPEVKRSIPEVIRLILEEVKR
jgi:hydrogenase maturation protease